MQFHRLNFRKILLLIVIAIMPVCAFARPWNEHQQSFGVTNSKLLGLEADIKALIEEKRKTDDPQQLRIITQAMADKHREMEKLVKERREEMAHVRFQHPEKGDLAKRLYTFPDEVKSLEDMERGYGLDARLDRVQAKVRHTYGTSVPEKKEDEHVRLPASEATKAPKANPDADEQIRLSK